MLTVAIELLRDGLLEEMKPLLVRHHAALGWFRDRMPLDPQYDAYLLAEQRGEVIVAALREDGVLVGYHVTFVRRGLHYRRTVTATQDIVFVTEGARRRGGGRMLFEAAEAEALRRMGPAGGLMIANSKVTSADHAGLDHLLRGRGYASMDLYYAKWLE